MVNSKIKWDEKLSILACNTTRIPHNTVIVVPVAKYGGTKSVCTVV